MVDIKNVLFGGLLLFLSSNLCAQANYKKSIFIDGTYLLSFLKTSEEKITPLNMKLFLKDDIHLRFGFDLNNSSADNKKFEGSIMLGLEKTHKYSPKWSYGYGIDINNSYTYYNSNSNSLVSYSLIPFFAFEVDLTEEFSLVYEPKLFLNYYKYSTPDSFIKETDEYESKISGLSQFFLKFNF